MSIVSIREAAVEDIPAVFDIRLSVAENAMTLEELAAVGITPESVETALQNQSRIWIADVDGRSQAFAMADLDEGCVFAMFVRPGNEGKGLGGRLMAAAESALFDSHETIWLTTGSEPELRAHGFYQRLGWRPAGVADNGERRYEKTRPSDSRDDLA